MTKHVHKAIRRKTQKAKRIMFEICSQFDNYKQSFSSSLSESEDKEPEQNTRIVTQPENYEDKESYYDSQDF